MLTRKRRLAEKSSAVQKGSILDVGTGTGFFLNEMREHKWKVTGVEKSDEARKFSKAEFGLDILSPDKLFELDKNSYDVISLWHVLEHIHEIDKTMNTFSQLLKNNGKLIIAVPNHTSYDAKHYKKFWAAYDVPRHIWHFGPEQMKKLAKKHGFNFKSLHTMPFDSFYVSMLSEKYKKSSLGFIRGITHGTFSWLNTLFNKSKCSSLIYVFEKS